MVSMPSEAAGLIAMMKMKPCITEKECDKSEMSILTILGCSICRLTNFVVVALANSIVRTQKQSHLKP